MKCPTPLRDKGLLEYIEQTHQQFAREKVIGSFAVEFHYGLGGELTIVHRGPIVRQRVMAPDREVLTLD